MQPIVREPSHPTNPIPHHPTACIPHNRRRPSLYISAAHLLTSDCTTKHLEMSLDPSFDHMRRGTHYRPRPEHSLDCSFNLDSLEATFDYAIEADYAKAPSYWRRRRGVIDFPFRSSEPKAGGDKQTSCRLHEYTYLYATLRGSGLALLSVGTTASIQGGHAAPAPSLQTFVVPRIMHNRLNRPSRYYRCRKDDQKTSDTLGGTLRFRPAQKGIVLPTLITNSRSLCKHFIYYLANMRHDYERWYSCQPNFRHAVAPPFLDMVDRSCVSSGIYYPIRQLERSFRHKAI